MPLDTMAPAGAEPDAGGMENVSTRLVCPACSAAFEQVKTEGEGAAGGEDQSWEEELRHMTARTPETEGQPQ